MMTAVILNSWPWVSKTLWKWPGNHAIAQSSHSPLS
jgi:hypothetical protein